MPDPATGETTGSSSQRYAISRGYDLPFRVVKGEAGATIQACGSCHLMSGQGHPESADIAGLPAEYIIRQMKYFKSRARKEEDRMGPIARATSDEEVRLAAEYFAAIKPIPFVKVIETATPPKTYVATAGRHRVVVPDGGTEPIGRRIIQIPEDVFRTTIRDPHSPFLAYVPPGSIARGAALVKTGGSGKTISCAICHGDSLTGLGEVPRIAGLQPVYIARQLITIQNGSSAGTAVALMKKATSSVTAVLFVPRVEGVTARPKAWGEPVADRNLLARQPGRLFPLMSSENRQ